VNGRHHLGQFLVQSPLFFGAELAPYFALALAGAALTGFGYSLVYPGLRVEAIRRVAPQNRGLAMGAYTAFLDVALGFGIPALGLLASWQASAPYSWQAPWPRCAPPRLPLSFCAHPPARRQHPT
jgi:MFS family permease